MRRQRASRRRASLVRLGRQRRRQVGAEVAQLGEDAGGLGQPDRPDSRREDASVGDRTEDLDDRLIGERPLPASGRRRENQSAITQPGGERLHEARLADARLARDQNHPAATGLNLRERLPQLPAGHVASHQGHVEAGQRGPGGAGDGGLHWSLAALQGALVDGAGLRQRADAELTLQDSGAALELAECSAPVPPGGVEGDEAAMDVLRQLVGGEVAPRRGDGGVELLARGVSFDEGHEDIEIGVLTVSLLLDEPGLELGAPGEGEAGQEGATVEIGGPAEGFEPALRVGQPYEREEVGGDAVPIEADAVVGGDQHVWVRQGAAQVGQEAREIAPGVGVCGVRPEEESKLLSGDRIGLGGQAVEEGADLATGDGQNGTAPFHSRWTE
ncbi:MAG: hypothetical protein U9R79_01435 [Armatimonadota bacterium]|nr:hypothetical protein [Armatimonadota bacterium]